MQLNYLWVEFAVRAQINLDESEFTIYKIRSYSYERLTGRLYLVVKEESERNFLVVKRI